ncbi:MAG: hypothetical protein JO244_13860 [Solirubrobacterales bacterium]|nr:hypothetical protein [Solirubrobacterales bacterium]
MAMTTLAEGSLIFGCLLVLGGLVLAYSLYTRRGSGISRQPYGNLDHSSAAETQSELEDDATDEIKNMGRGTAGHHGRAHPPDSAG